MKIKALIFFILEPFLIVVYEGKHLLPSKFQEILVMPVCRVPI